MSIMWKYLDKRSATIAALKDYDSMKFIIDSTGEEVRGNYESMAGVGGMKYDGMPKGHNPKAGEDRILNGLEAITFCGSVIVRQRSS